MVDHFRNYRTDLAKTGYEWANFIPFKTLYYYLSLQEDAETGLQNIGGNIFLFIPYGFLLPLLFTAARSLIRVVIIVLATSLFFELLQLLFAIGNFDVDDLVLNAAGGVCGYGLFLLFQRLRRA